MMRRVEALKVGDSQAESFRQQSVWPAKCNEALKVL